ARGNEAAGRVGEFSSFVLLQRLLGDNRVDLPIWLCGGIGVHTAAAAVIGGAVGVVLDTQLALLPEADLPAEAIAAIAASDGSDTAVLGGHRVHAGSPVGTADADTAAATMTEAEVAAALGGRDLATQLLPLGQDAFLATRFSEKYGTAARSIGAVRRAITDTVRAGSLSLLAPGAPLARALGTELPVAQGPMTRVSDQAGFAASVAEHGALPFIALALASGEQTRTLLAETKVALGEKPWGVGVLGFAPEDVRAAQLDVIRESRPSVALIAGGHPAQAAELEAEGITTFLHVASPRLLRQFVEAGARRFVFEGAECGGHVGPRSSFSLWEAQIGVLLDCLDSSQRVDGLSVLFAGGVHDHRSAAIVSALAEPLAGRGVAVGVLMGTGYLFTEEAVSHGAVQPQFQRQVLAAEDTALLETAPGHATRCLATPFAESFRAISHDLTAQGLPKRQVWEELEALNVGRLRIASKGLRREGADLVAVSEAGQLTEGLFMAGQVVALRSRVTTVAKLHESVTRGAMAFREEREQDLRTRLGISEWQAELAPPPADVAIVGMACVFPGAPDLASFWANIVGKVDAVTEVPEERWPAETYFAQGARRGAGDSTPSKWGGFLPKVPFDALRYGIPPATLAAIEPVQLLALEVAQRALTDAGYGEGGFDRSRASVVFGAESGSDLSNAATLRMVLPSYLGELPASLEGQLPKLTEDSFPGSLSNVIAGRIANRLDLGGANYTVDAACAASLAALDAACHELVGETSDLVLCGGADLHNAINDYLLFSAVGALSPSGRCRTFDESADGIALGEGVACVALKRLTDAERDGDRIYAVVEGVGKASDGKSLGLTAPRPEGQRRALHRAYLNAGISPAQVGMIEAHGTGTAVGDRTELETLDAMFAEAGAEEGSCALGSVKSQIGHTKCAAGLAGLIKAAMAVHTGVKPPTLHISRPNPAWREGASPFAFHGNAAPWTRPPEERVAGVSAFGFGGTNFHVVLRGHGSAETVRHGLHEWPVELFTFRGKDHALACREVERLRTLIATNDAHGRPWRLRDLARTASVWADRGRGPVQIAVVAGDLDELATLLGDAISGTPRPTGGLFLAAGSADEGSGKLAVVFPGQGSQRPGMVAELAVVFPEVQRFARLSHQVASAMFPPTAFGAQARAGQAERLRDTRMAQPAMGIAGLAMNHLLARLDVRPDMVAGHSYGELVALAAAGSFDADTLLCISAERADAILDAAGSDSGGMAAVAAEPADVERVLTEAGVSGEVVAANYNAPRQIVISGPTPQLERALTALRSAGLPAKQLPVACAFHSPVVREAGSRFAEMLAKYRFAPPELPVWSNRTAGVYGQTAMAVRDELAAQIGSPVRFVYQIEAMYAAGARVFFEPGPGKVLGRLIDTILGDRPHTMVNCEGTAGTGLRGFLSAVAQLAVAGVELR
ncbi:MAG: beta-ketoacyl synthase N-terminal-like domain-containing protein, partial [Sciscionella sp.]